MRPSLPRIAKLFRYAKHLVRNYWLMMMGQHHILAILPSIQASASLACCPLQDPEFCDANAQQTSPTASNYPAIAPPSSNASV